MKNSSIELMLFFYFLLIKESWMFFIKFFTTLKIILRIITEQQISILE